MFNGIDREFHRIYRYIPNIRASGCGVYPQLWHCSWGNFNHVFSCHTYFQTTDILYVSLWHLYYGYIISRMKIQPTKCDSWLVSNTIECNILYEPPKRQNRLNFALEGFPLLIFLLVAIYRLTSLSTKVFFKKKLLWYPQQPQRFIFTNLSEACCEAKRWKPSWIC